MTYMTTKKKDIEILRVSYLRGPNIWTYRPVIEAWLDIGGLEDFPSNLIPGLYERLTTLLPGLIEHRCGVGERGGFLERLREGTWAGHILEHVVLELQNMAGMRTGFGQTRSTSEIGVYKMAFRTREESVGRRALAIGRDLLMAAINDQPFDLEPLLTDLRDQVDSRCLGPSTSHIVDAATDRRIPHLRLSSGNLVQIGHGKAQRRIWTAETDRTSAIAESIASDKDLTKTLLKAAGIPIPEGSLVHSAEEAWEEAQDIGVPVVVKPYDGNHGRGVSLNLMTKEDVESAYHLAVQKGGSSAIIVEKYIVGDEHRVLVVGERVVAVGKGESLWITADGTSTVVQLIDAQINTDPRRGTTEEFPLNIIDINEAVEVVLELTRQGLTGESVPPAGQKILIQHNGNVALDVTDQIHPDVARVATLAARVVGLDIAGIDMVAEDISRPLQEQSGAIIEVNASPGLLAHIKPSNGPGRNVGEAIMAHLFAPGESGRIDVIGISGSRNTTLIAHLTSALVRMNGKYTGVACQDGLYLNNRLVTKGNCTRWEDGERLLINRSVEAAIFENSPRNILTDGLSYDRCRIGIVTDMPDTTGLSEFYIHDADQMRKVIRTQVDVVLADGAAVLNADNAEVAGLAELCDGDVLLYAISADLDVIREHRANGKRAVVIKDGVITLAQAEAETALIPVQALPATLASQTESVLAAVAAGWAMDIEPELMAAGLRTFHGK